MPRRPFPVFVGSVGLAVLVFTVLRPVFGQPTAPPAPPAADDPAQFQKVRVEPTVGGSTVEGKLKLAGVTLKTETGSTTVGMKFVKRIARFRRSQRGNRKTSCNSRTRPSFAGV